MNLDDNLYIIWFENEQGHRWVPDLAGNGPPATKKPEEFYMMYSEHPHVVNKDISVGARRSEVDACAHDGKMRPDLGLIDGFKGRYCTKCGGYQSCKEDEPWPDAWDASHSHHLASGGNTYMESLVLAMTRPTEAERQLAVARELERTEKVGEKIEGPLYPKAYPLRDAVLIAARSCERCLNALLWRYGCGGDGGDAGYPEYSEAWKKAGTACIFCEPVLTLRETEAAA